ncbi:helix-turn-helix domain-containing protein [Sphaerisporangium sp. NPDC004334]
MSEGTGQASNGRRRAPNHVLISRRESLGWSRRRAAREFQRIGEARGLGTPELEALEKALYRHESGLALCRDPLYVELYCAAYNATAHELFGEVVPLAEAGERYGVRSHKFIAVYIGAERVADLAARALVTPGTSHHGLGCMAREVTHDEGLCRLHVWPFGVAIFHLVEDLDLPNIAHLAVWRRRTYAENLAWASRYISDLVQAEAEAAYVLSLYWVHSPIWPAHQIDTALRIICFPKTLLARDPETSENSLAHAELVERSLLAEGFDYPEMISFGVKGISLGYASWSGVVYSPTAPQRSLAEDELVSTELATQAIWAYCAHINEQIEQGRDPTVPAEYGWRFLRGVRSRLTNPRPQETDQHRFMRAAILDTSGLPGHLSQAIDILRETSEG